MGLIKELPHLSLIVMICIPIMASKAVPKDRIQVLKEKMKEELELSFCNLDSAAKNYYRYTSLPFNSTNEKKLEGITWEMRNETAVRKSICAIVGYLESLPAVVKHVIGDHYAETVTSNTDVFLELFNKTVMLTDFAATPQQQCSRNLSSLDAYTTKMTIFNILNNTMMWVRNFTEMKPSC